MSQKQKGKECVYHLTSAVCSGEEYDRVTVKDEYKVAQAPMKFFRVFLEGFIENGKNVKVFSKRPTTKMSSGKRYLPSKNENDGGIFYHYCRNFHFRFINAAYSLLASFFWYMRKKNCNKGDLVFIDPLNVAISSGTLRACKLRGIPVVAFVTDIPECYAYGGEKMSRSMRACQKLMRKADSYIFLTEQMNSVVNPTGKPYTVIEGFVDSHMSERENSIDDKHKEKVCMYTGGLEEIYGLDMLVEGFMKADVPNSELHIYGAGGFAEKLEEYAKIDKRIKFFGCRDNSYVVEQQMKATLLINPRYTDAEYTKYSFPSKTSEYIVSGTPTLTTRLPGIPKEYFDNVFVLDSENTDGMAEKIREILNMPTEELHTFGSRAKAWILKNKNNKAQIEKIITFVKEIRCR